MAAEFEIYKRDGKYRWRLKANIHGVAAFGEDQPTRDDALRDIEAVKRMVAKARIDDHTGEYDDPESDD